MFDIGSAVGGFANAVSAESINSKNIAFQERENAITRQREDTAYERAVSDARKAGLSPLAVVGTGGASSQVLSAPQVSHNPLQSGLDTFNAMRANQSQIDYNNALTGKTIEEAKGQSINNASANARYMQQLAHLLEQTNNLKVTTSREKVFLEKYRERLLEELKGLTLGNEGKAVSNLISERSRVWNEKVGMNPATSWSASATTPIGQGVVVGKSLAEQKELDSNNAMADKNKVDDLYKEYTKEYQALFNSLMKDWKKSYESAKESFKGKPDGYVKLQAWLKDNPKPVYKPPRRSDFQ